MASTYFTSHTDESTSYARLAGLAYLVIIAAGVTADLILRAPFKTADASELAVLFSTRETAFRLSLVADMTMIAADIALAGLFYVLLRAANQMLALSVLILRLVQAAIIATSVVLLAGVPGLIATEQADLASVMIQLHGIGYDVGLFFFGFNSLLMWRLLRLSGGVPAMLATGIGLSGLVYISGSLLRLTMPEALPMFEVAYLLPLVAETSFCLWLLTKARV